MGPGRAREARIARGRADRSATPDRGSIDRGDRRPHLPSGPARLRRRARPDRLPVAERVIQVRLLSRSLDADLRSRVLDWPRARPVGEPDQRYVRPRTWRLVLREILGADRAVAVHARRPRQYRRARHTDRARPAGSRVALRVPGMVRRVARLEEHRGGSLVRDVAEGAGRPTRHGSAARRHRRVGRWTADARHVRAGMAWIGRGRRRPVEPRPVAQSGRSPLGHHRSRDVRSGAGAGAPLSARGLHVRRRTRDVHELRWRPRPRARDDHGANVTTKDASIGIDEPFPFRFQGTTIAVDLRRLPEAIPVPHVESLLAFDYDVSGRFSEPFIIGRAQFARSQFLGATVGAGTVGSIDTLQKPIRYTGDGDVAGISLRRFGEELQVGWLQDPRYAGTVSGHFRVDGSGTAAATLTLTGGGRLSRAEFFKGTLSNADVEIAIGGGTLRASYDGGLDTIDPAIPFADPRLDSSLTGKGRVNVTVHDLLNRSTTVADYEVDGTLTLERSK